ncbi:PKD domain-containing protein [bacterium]|nr:PKD domain-containing protein [bacterium]
MNGLTKRHKPILNLLFLSALFLCLLLINTKICQAQGTPGGNSDGLPSPIIQELIAGEFEIIPILDDQGNHTGNYKIEMLTPGYGTMDSPGDPALPEKFLEFQVNPNIRWQSINLDVVVEESEILSGYPIAPNPPVRPVEDGEYDPDDEDWGPEKSIVNGQNMYVYGKDENFPSNTVELLPFTERKEPLQSQVAPSAVGIPQKGFVEKKYIRVFFRPFLFNPVKNELLLIKKAMLTITYETDSNSLILYKLGKTSGGSYDYVIITSNNIVANSGRLANFIHLKGLQGHNVLLVTETDFNPLTGQAPNGTAEKIRQWLKNNYISLGIDYVLLIGNPDPDNPFESADTVGDIPMKMCWPNYFSYHYRESPTDYFYADLTGNWDLDNDLIFGEGIEHNHAKSPDPAIGADYFSARWSGKVMCDFNETYEFHTFSDDGVRLYLDGSLEIDNWAEHSPQSDYATLAMTAGKHDIVVEFRENTGDGIIQLFWKTTVPKGHANYVGHQIIPEDHLYDNSDTVGGLSAIYYDNADFTGASITRKDNVINFIWATGDQGPGGPDPGAEVFVGRIPVYDNNYAQLDNILQKIIEYETDTGDISWRKSILLPMKPLWDDTPAYHLGEGIFNDFLPFDFSYYRIYDDDYAPPTPESHPCLLNSVKNEWKLTRYGIVVWTTHGSQEGAGDVFNSASTTELDDSKPSFTFQASCLNGYPENKNNLGYALLKNGAIATLSASRVSWDSGGAWTFDPHSGDNHNIAYFYTKKIIADFIPKSAGVALYLTKGNLPKVLMNEMDYNLYGEPDCYLLVTFPNQPPVAEANGPYTGDEGSTLTFSAAGSYDPEGDTLEYRWDFEADGVWDTGWSSASTASYSWCDDHTGTIKVQVRDQLGFTGEDSASVTVNNVPPAAEAGLDQTALEGDILSFSGSFTDPGCDTWTTEWDFGDGSPVVSGTLTPNHAYGDNGIYTVTLKVTDDDGGTGTDTLTVTVSNVAPTAQIVSMDQPNPQFILPIVHTLTFNGSFTDPGWLDTHTSVWDFGDGNSIAGALSEENLEPDSTGTTTSQYVYSEPGTYTVTLTVKDDDGGEGTDSITVIVVDAEGAKHDIRDYIMGLPDSSFRPPVNQRKNAFENKFEVIDKMIQNDNDFASIQKLFHDIRSKCDGSVDGDLNNDWIIDPAAQAEICMKIDDLIAYLEYLDENNSKHQTKWGPTAKMSSILDLGLGFMMTNAGEATPGFSMTQYPPFGFLNQYSFKNANAINNAFGNNNGNHLGWLNLKFAMPLPFINTVSPYEALFPQWTLFQTPYSNNKKGY